MKVYELIVELLKLRQTDDVCLETMLEPASNYEPVEALFVEHTDARPIVVLGRTKLAKD